MPTARKHTAPTLPTFPAGLPLAAGLDMAATHRPVFEGLALYTLCVDGAVSDFAAALYGPGCKLGWHRTIKAPEGHVVACFVAAHYSGPAFPVFVPA